MQADNPDRGGAQASVISESRGAQLVRNSDGTVGCHCPFACLAVSERCEFTGHPDYEAAELRRRRDRFIDDLFGSGRTRRTPRGRLFRRAR